MEVHNNNKIHWTICSHCHGQGKILRGPSKKRRRLYQKDLEAYEMDNKEGAPNPPGQNLDVCFCCKGSGLMSSEKETELNKNYPNIAIIGGGIGGVALAVACLHRGIPFTLYERDKSFNARSQGYGLTLQQASKAIEGLGIFSLDGGIISTKHVVHNPDGKIIGEWGMRKWMKTSVKETSRRKNIHIARQSLRSAFLKQLNNHPSLKWGHTLTDFSQNKDGNIDLGFHVEGKTTRSTADLVIGADGIRSSVRSLLIGENKTPLQYLGCMVILGICSLESIKSSKRSLLDSATVFQTVNGRERIYMMPYDKDRIMWQLSFPLSETKAGELSSQGQKSMKQEALLRLEQWHDPISQILEATLEPDITGYPVYDRKLLDPKLLQQAASVSLIGDAAHPMSPFKGQGANQAILDALSLARKISIECGPDSRWRERGLRKSVLTEFEKEMLERTASKVQSSAVAARLLHSDLVLHEGDEPRGRGIGTKN
jgi:2-polyprenyl-6-methoxyphenol hydroxylase-like FAD-dependent oxidoreductase